MRSSILRVATVAVISATLACGGGSSNNQPDSGVYWAGTYTAQSSSSYQSPASIVTLITGMETITQSGATVTVQAFAAPVLTGCNLVISGASTAAVSVQTGENDASINQQACGGDTIAAGSAFLQDQSGAPYIGINAVDTDGGHFSVILMP
jgi:hypothetical protein